MRRDSFYITPEGQPLPKGWTRVNATEAATPDGWRVYKPHPFRQRWRAARPDYEPNGFWLSLEKAIGAVDKLRQEFAERRARAPLEFAAFDTDDVLDAPDGSVLFLEDYGCYYRRSGTRWFKLGLDPARRA